MPAFGDSVTDYGNLFPDGYVPVLGTALGITFANHAVSGATMLGTEELVPGVLRSSIRDQALAIPPPTQYEPVVMMLGINDMSLYGTDAPHLALFDAALQTMLLHLTSRRRIPEPRTEPERRLLREHKLPSVPGCPAVWVGNCLTQATGNYVVNGSPAAVAAYNATISARVAAVAALGRPVHYVDVSSVYVPSAAMSNDAPSYTHPNTTGHAALAAKFLADMRA